jgi:hypothetical protein
MDGRGERCDYRNPKHGCEDRQSHMRAPSIAPIGIVVHGQHPLEHQSTQLRGAGSASRPVIEENIVPIRAWLITMQPASA